MEEKLVQKTRIVCMYMIICQMIITGRNRFYKYKLSNYYKNLWP